MLTIEQKRIKNEIMENLGVDLTEDFDVKIAIRERVNYLKSYLKSTDRKAIVLGISGGVDSSTAGKLSQMAMSELRNEGYDAKFVAVRLPSGVQKDEDDAQEALKFISPDVVHTVNIGDASNFISQNVVDSFEVQGSNLDDMLMIEDFEDKIDFHRGNVKARMRMISQYQLAGIYSGLVLGTDHNSENVTGFYTLHGDGACDLLVLNGLNKRQVRLIAKDLGAPEWLYAKKATADLEDDKPQLLDEDSLGISYDQIDDFLEGKEVDLEKQKLLIDRYAFTEFKRRMPIEFKKGVK
jgi:NAD+ synthase